MEGRVYETLNPHCETIRSLGRLFTIVRHCAGMIMVHDIITTGATGGRTASTFLSNIVLALLNLKFYFITKDAVTAQICIFGIIMNLFYLFLYFIFTPDEYSDSLTVWNVVSMAGIFLFSCLLLVEHEDEGKIEYHLGMLLSGIFIFLAGSPLLNLREIIRYNAAIDIRLYSVCLGITASFIWILYGLSTKNSFIVAQNACICFLNLAQMIVFFYYPPNTLRRRRSRSRRRTHN